LSSSLFQSTPLASSCILAGAATAAFFALLPAVAGAHHFSPKIIAVILLCANSGSIIRSGGCQTASTDGSC
jgi:hypothetical protein